jgi:hypothetical protein
LSVFSDIAAEHRAKQRGLEHLQDGFEVCDAMLEIEEGRVSSVIVFKPARGGH